MQRCLRWFFPWERALIILGVLVAIYYFVILAVLDRMYEVHRVMCSGNLDYVHGETPVGVTAASLIRKDLIINGPAIGSYEIMAKLQPSNLKEVEHLTALHYLNFTASYGDDPVSSLAVDMTQEYMLPRLPCSPATLWLAEPSLKSLVRHLTKDDSLQGCSDVAKYCLGSYSIGSNLNMKLRGLCPTDCGCHDPRAGSGFSAFDYAVSGCPPACLVQYQATLATMPCVDVPSDDPGLHLWVDELLAGLVRGAVMYPEDEAAVLRKEANGTGCSFFSRSFTLPYYGAVSFCSPIGPVATQFSSVANLCPETCGCSSGNNSIPNCPGTCTR